MRRVHRSSNVLEMRHLGPRQREALKAERVDHFFDDLPDDEGVNKWAAVLTRDWRDTVASVIKTGRDLIQAKKELGHGRFCDLFIEEYLEEGRKDPLCSLVPFTHRTANRLMKIARNKVLADSTHESILPTSWPTLHVLACIPEDKLEELIRARKIYPNLTRKEAERLAGPNRVVGAIKALVGAMIDAKKGRKSMDALVADARETMADKDDEHSKKEWDAFGSLAELAAFIAEMDEAWQRADDDAERGEAEATELKEPKAKGKRAGSMRRADPA